MCTLAVLTFNNVISAGFDVVLYILILCDGEFIALFMATRSFIPLQNREVAGKLCKRAAGLYQYIRRDASVRALSRVRLTFIHIFGTCMM